MAKLHYEYEEGTKPDTVNQFMLQRVAVGALVLCIVNIGLFFASPLAKVNPDDLPAAHTWVWWATQEFLQQHRAPDVVMLGSSLLMHPVSRQDANYLGHDIDYVKHHRSNYMEDRLSEKGISGTICYNFALPGGMISDDYMVARTMFAAHKPAVIILGLSVRDFIDNGVHCAGATPAFKYLKRFTQIDDLVDVSMPQLWQRFDYLCGKFIYLWGKKLDLQVLLAEKCKSNLGPWYARMFPPSKLVQADPSRNQPSNLRAEVEAGMMIVQHDMPYSYEDNSQEYKKRYRSPNIAGLSVQKFFFEKLLQDTQRQGIKVVIFNMPLTPTNHRLMPKGSYENYLAMLHNQAQRYGCQLVDLDSTGDFKQDNYYDTAHMNASGGKRLVEAMVSTLTGNKELLAALQTGTGPKTVASQSHSY
jgi:hypothetical protein